MTGRNWALLLVVPVLGVLFLLLYVSSTQTRAAPRAVTVVIPEGASNQQSDHNNFEPDTITVVIGVNNTVSWVNRDDTISSVVSDTDDDTSFAAATRFEGKAYLSNPPSMLNPGDSFEFTFTNPGTFGYHSEPHPWMHGSVVVLPSS